MSNQQPGPDQSDYRALGLSGPRTIGPSNYRAPGLSGDREPSIVNISHESKSVGSPRLLFGNGCV